MITTHEIRKCCFISENLVEVELGSRQTDLHIQLIMVQDWKSFDKSCVLSLAFGIDGK